MSADDARLCIAVGCTSPEGTPRRVIDNRLVCPGCAERGLTALRSMPHRWVSLKVSLRPGSPSTEHVTGPGFGSTSPVRDAAMAAMDDIERWAIKSEADLRETMHLAPRRMLNGSLAVIKFVALAAPFWNQALMYSAGAQALNGADYWRRHTDLILGWDRLVHRLPAPCPYCDTVTLIRRDGDDSVRCRLCRRSWAEAEYRHFVKMLVDEVTHDQPAHP